MLHPMFKLQTVFGLLMMMAALPALAGEGDGVTATLTGPGCAYEAVTLELVERHGAPMAGVRKRFPEGFGHRQSVGLLPDEEFARDLGTLEALGLFSLPDGPSIKRGARTTWTITARKGDQVRVFTVHDPEQLPSLKWWRLITRLRTLVEARTEPLPFRDNLLLPDEAGLLQISANPPARITLNGVPTGETTPVTNLKVPKGAHAIGLTAVEGEAHGTWTVHVEAGKTTVLRVDLR